MTPITFSLISLSHLSAPLLRQTKPHYTYSYFLFLYSISSYLPFLPLPSFLVCHRVVIFFYYFHYFHHISFSSVCATLRTYYAPILFFYSQMPMSHFLLPSFLICHSFSSALISLLFHRFLSSPGSFLMVHLAAVCAAHMRTAKLQCTLDLVRNCVRNVVDGRCLLPRSHVTWCSVIAGTAF